MDGTDAGELNWGKRLAAPSTVELYCVDEELDPDSHHVVPVPRVSSLRNRGWQWQSAEGLES